MGTDDPQELRNKAEYYRSLVMVGGDTYFHAALLQLADEFATAAAESGDGPRHGSAETTSPA
jgi:hypothetical protein